MRFPCENNPEYSWDITKPYTDVFIYHVDIFCYFHNTHVASALRLCYMFVLFIYFEHIRHNQFHPLFAYNSMPAIVCTLLISPLPISHAILVPAAMRSVRSVFPLSAKGAGSPVWLPVLAASPSGHRELVWGWAVGPTMFAVASTSRKYRISIQSCVSVCVCVIVWMFFCCRLCPECARVQGIYDILMNIDMFKHKWWYS